jgi:hypothetical protein
MCVGAFIAGMGILLYRTDWSTEVKTAVFGALGVWEWVTVWHPALNILYEVHFTFLEDQWDC